MKSDTEEFLIKHNKHIIIITGIILVVASIYMVASEASEIQTPIQKVTYKPTLPTYFDSNGIERVLTESNLIEYPLYNKNDNKIWRKGKWIEIDENNEIVTYEYYPDRIVPKYTFQNESELMKYRKGVSPNFFFDIIWDASNIKSVSDDMIDMDEFKRTLSVTAYDSKVLNDDEEGTNNYNISASVAGKKIKFSLKEVDFTNITYPLYIAENTIYVYSNTSDPSWSGITISGNAILNPNNGDITADLENQGYMSRWEYDQSVWGSGGQGLRDWNRTSANDGTWYGSVTPNWTSDGLQFDGVDDYVEILDSPKTRLAGGAGTISAWIYPLSLGGGDGGRIIDKSTSIPTADGYSLSLTPDNRTIFRTPSDTATLSSINAIILNTLQQVAVTFNGTARRLYVNGIDVTTVLGTQTGTPPNIAGNVRIGNRAGAIDRGFNGTMKRVLVRGDAQSQETINLSDYYKQSYNINTEIIDSVLGSSSIQISGTKSSDNVSIAVDQIHSDDGIVYTITRLSDNYNFGNELETLNHRYNSFIIYSNTTYQPEQAIVSQISITTVKTKSQIITENVNVISEIIGTVNRSSENGCGTGFAGIMACILPVFTLPPLIYGVAIVLISSMVIYFVFIIRRRLYRR